MRSNTKSKIADVRKRLETLRVAMLDASSEEMDYAVQIVEHTTAALQELNAIPDQEHDEVRREVTFLREDLARIALLCQGGEEFCRRWGLSIQSAAGYLSTGQAAPLTPTSKVAIQG